VAPLPKTEDRREKIGEERQQGSWPVNIRRVFHPDGDQLEGRRLNETIRTLKKGLKNITVRADGTGSGVIWEPARRRPQRQEQPTNNT